MEEKKEVETSRYFHIENVGKNIITTIIGSVLMSMSVLVVILEWFFGFKTPAEPWQVALIFVVGFALLFMRDRLATYIDIFAKKKIGGE